MANAQRDYLKEYDAAPADHPFTDDYADLLTYLRLGF